MEGDKRLSTSFLGAGLERHGKGQKVQLDVKLRVPEEIVILINL